MKRIRLMLVGMLLLVIQPFLNVNEVSAQGTVPITVAPEEGLTFATQLHQGYNNNTMGKQVTISKPDGTTIENLTAYLSGGGNSKFIVGTILTDSLGQANSNSVALMVRPKNALWPGTYTETLTILGDNAVSDSIDLTFTVDPQPQGALILEPATAYDFGTFYEGYKVNVTADNAIAKKQLNLIKVGHTFSDMPNVQASFGKGLQTQFTIGTILKTTLEPGTSSASTLIGVKPGLPSGTYTDTLTVTADGGVSESIALTVTILDVHTVEFRISATDVFNSQKIRDEEYAVLPTPPTKVGYAFDGWYTDAGFTQAFNTSIPVTQDIVIYAKWNTNSYVVHFNSNGGSAIAPQTVEHFSRVVKPTNPNRSRYTLVGWYTDETLQNSYSFDSEVTGGFTLYAKWSAIPSGGGSNPAPPQSQLPVVEEIIIDIDADGDNGGTVSQTPIKRTTNLDGTVKDDVTLTQESAMETIEKLKAQGVNKARIVIPDLQDKVNEVNISIPKNVVSTLKNGNIDLEIVTDNVRITIPKESMGTFNDDLYFRLIPIKKQEEKQELEQRAKKEREVQQMLAVNTGKVEVLGRPMTIETNMQNRPVTVTMPIEQYLPAEPTERDALLKDLVVYIEHSDGSKEVIRGSIVSDKFGKLQMEFNVTKFSTFTIMFVEDSGKKFDTLSCSENLNCLKALKTVPIYKIENDRLNLIESLKKDEITPFIRKNEPMLGLGGPVWVERSVQLKYETPSKAMLISMKLNPDQHITWKNLKLQPGQIGLVTILNDTIVWSNVNATNPTKRILKKGERYRVYRFTSSMYELPDQKYILDQYVETLD